jgi:uncharacterized membrane protein YgcG
MHSRANSTPAVARAVCGDECSLAAATAGDSLAAPVMVDRPWLSDDVLTVCADCTALAVPAYIDDNEQTGEVISALWTALGRVRRDGGSASGVLRALGAVYDAGLPRGHATLTGPATAELLNDRLLRLLSSSAPRVRRHAARLVSVMIGVEAQRAPRGIGNYCGCVLVPLLRLALQLLMTDADEQVVSHARGIIERLVAFPTGGSEPRIEQQAEHARPSATIPRGLPLVVPDLLSGFLEASCQPSDQPMASELFYRHGERNVDSGAASSRTTGGSGGGGGGGGGGAATSEVIPSPRPLAHQGELHRAVALLVSCDASTAANAGATLAACFSDSRASIRIAAAGVIGAWIALGAGVVPVYVRKSRGNFFLFLVFGFCFWFLICFFFFFGGGQFFFFFFANAIIPTLSHTQTVLLPLSRLLGPSSPFRPRMPRRTGSCMRIASAPTRPRRRSSTARGVRWR